jgi:hypothetical protein
MEGGTQVIFWKEFIFGSRSGLGTHNDKRQEGNQQAEAFQVVNGTHKKRVDELKCNQFHQPMPEKLHEWV